MHSPLQLLSSSSTDLDRLHLLAGWWANTRQELQFINVSSRVAAGESRPAAQVSACPRFRLSLLSRMHTSIPPSNQNERKDRGRHCTCRMSRMSPRSSSLPLFLIATLLWNPSISSAQRNMTIYANDPALTYSPPDAWGIILKQALGDGSARVTSRKGANVSLTFQGRYTVITSCFIRAYEPLSFGHVPVN